MRYRNVRTGRELERPAPDEWLEASSGWERVVEDDELEPGAEADIDRKEPTE